MTTVSFIFTLFAQPIVGAFSDRTRSRLGRRAPWMLIGSSVAAIFLLGLGGMQNVLWITIFWVVIQVALNALQGPLSAIVPDRFPRSKRGAASAMVGMGMMIGATVGTVGAGQFASNVGIGYTVFGVGVLVVTVLFVLFNRDGSSVGPRRRTLQLEAVPLRLLDQPQAEPRLRLGIRRPILLHPRLLRHRRVQPLHPHRLHRPARCKRRDSTPACSPWPAWSPP